MSEKLYCYNYLIPTSYQGLATPLIFINPLLKGFDLCSCIKTTFYYQEVKQTFLPVVWNFSGSSVVRTWCFYCQGLGSILSGGAKIP